MNRPVRGAAEPLPSKLWRMSLSVRPLAETSRCTAPVALSYQTPMTLLQKWRDPHAAHVQGLGTGLLALIAIATFPVPP